jgi:hypothetical protein
MNKVEVIEQSVACQRFGARSFVPLIGIGAAIEAFRRYRHVRAAVGDEWNPARPQLIRGMILAWMGVLFTLLILAIAVLICVGDNY